MFPFNFSDFRFPADKLAWSLLSSFLVVVSEVLQFPNVTSVKIVLRRIDLDCYDAKRARSSFASEAQGLKFGVHQVNIK